MRFDTAVFIRPKDKLECYFMDGGAIAIGIVSSEESGCDLRLHFASLEVAERFADQIFHLRMDRDAAASNAASLTELAGKAIDQMLPEQVK